MNKEKGNKEKKKTGDYYEEDESVGGDKEEGEVEKEVPKKGRLT